MTFLFVLCICCYRRLSEISCCKLIHKTCGFFICGLFHSPRPVSSDSRGNIHTSPAVYAELYRNPIAGTPRIINYYEETGQLTVIEEYISGTSLQDKIRHADISPNEMLQYMLDLCTILEQLHLHNPAIIHRDVKPSNVIITSYNRAVLLDFNAAKYHTAAKDSDTILLGTQGYAAPEQYGFGQSSC